MRRAVPVVVRCEAVICSSMKYCDEIIVSEVGGLPDAELTSMLTLIDP